MKLIADWKEVVKNYLRQLKKNSCEGNVCCDLSQFEHYIDEAKKAHLEIIGFLGWNKEQLVEKILNDRKICFQNSFSLFAQEGITEEPTNRNRPEQVKKSRQSCGVLTVGSGSSSNFTNNKENIFKGTKPLKN